MCGESHCTPVPAVSLAQHRAAPAVQPRPRGCAVSTVWRTQCPARTACDRPEHFNYMPSVPCSTSGPVDRTRGPLSNAWSLQRLLSTAAHTACLLGWGWRRGTSSSSVPEDAVPRAVTHPLFQVRKRCFLTPFSGYLCAAELIHLVECVIRRLLVHSQRKHFHCSSGTHTGLTA